MPSEKFRQIPAMEETGTPSETEVGTGEPLCCRASRTIRFQRSALPDSRGRHRSPETGTITLTLSRDASVWVREAAGLISRQG